MINDLTDVIATDNNTIAEKKTFWQVLICKRLADMHGMQEGRMSRMNRHCRPGGSKLIGMKTRETQYFQWFFHSDGSKLIPTISGEGGQSTGDRLPGFMWCIFIHRKADAGFEDLGNISRKIKDIIHGRAFVRKRRTEISYSGSQARISVFVNT